MNIIGRHKKQVESLQTLCTFIDAAKLASQFAEIGEVATAFTTALDSCAELREPLRTCKLSLTGKMMAAFLLASQENLQNLNDVSGKLHTKAARRKWQRDFAFWAEGLAVAKSGLARRDAMAPELAGQEAVGLGAAKAALQAATEPEEARVPSVVPSANAEASAL